MQEMIRLYRRLEGDLLRSGRIVLQVDETYYDLTETLWKSGGPVLLSALCTRGFFESQRFSTWLEQTAPPETHPVTEEDVLLPPFLPVEVGKILALGKNFAAHAEEFSEPVPEEPLFFNKLPETLCGHNQEVHPPAGYEERFDHEVELAVIISTHAKNVSVEESYEHIAGYSVANDLTLRSWQGKDRKQQLPWFRSKNFESACPMGPCFVPEAVLNPAELNITASVNGELRQDANTRDLLISIPQALSYLSHHIPLHPGDVILMGTPAGVGALQDGDEVVCEIEQIGKLRSLVRR